MTIPRLLLAIALSLSATWTKADSLIVLDNANPPFMYELDGKPRGLYPLMLQAIFKRAGEPVEIRTVPWKRALKLGESGAAGIGGIYKNAERLKLFDYSAPLFEERLIVYVHRDKLFDFRGIEDLSDKDVGVIRGWSYSEAFDRAVRDGRIRRQDNTSDESNFKKLASGRLDAVIAIEQSGQRLLLHPHLENLVPLATPLSINPTYLVFAKSAKRQALLARFDASLQAMQEDGSLQALVQRASSTE